MTPDTHWIGSWVDSRVSLDGVEKRKLLTLLGLKLRPLGCPARLPKKKRKTMAREIRQFLAYCLVFKTLK
jgi:hypothetical protein